MTSDNNERLGEFNNEMERLKAIFTKDFCTDFLKHLNEDEQLDSIVMFKKFNEKFSIYANILSNDEALYTCKSLDKSACDCFINEANSVLTLLNEDKINIYIAYTLLNASRKRVLDSSAKKVLVKKIY